jgi:hypothetical protein
MDASPSGVSRHAMGSATFVSWQVWPLVHSALVAHSCAWPGEQDAWQVALPPASKFALAVLGEKQQTCGFAQSAALAQDTAAPS